MENSKSTTTLYTTGAKLTKSTSDSEFFDKEVYHSAIGSLLYLSTRTRQDITFAVGIVTVAEKEAISLDIQIQTGLAI